MNNSKNLKTILNLNNKDAKKYFMEPYTYCPTRLPKYFCFKSVLKEAKRLLANKNNIKDLENKNRKKQLQKYNDVNYTFTISKSRKYSWRPITLFNPIVYVDLVNTITKSTNWNEIIKRFKYYFPSKENIDSFTLKDKLKATDIRKHIKCVSIPLAITNNDRNKITNKNINNWSSNFEYKTIKLSLRYNYCMFTDISNCYGSIYTHSIAWALIGHDNAKFNRSPKLLGNLLDEKIRNLQYGQTNGIPQANDVCNLIAEMVLGYADKKLYESLKKQNKNLHYLILRYRDDFRIFSDSELDVEFITKTLSNILSKLNMTLNSSKTKLVKDLTLSALKPDKLHAIKCSSQFYCLKWLPKKLIFLKMFSNKFPNSGSLVTMLSKLYNQLMSSNAKSSLLYGDGIELSINIMTSILINNPQRSLICIVIINRLLYLLKNKNEKKIYMASILTKMDRVSHNSLEEIWLQRISILIGKKDHFHCKLCKKVSSVYKYIKSIKKDIKNYEIKLQNDNTSSLKRRINNKKKQLDNIVNKTPNTFWDKDDIIKLWNNNWLMPKYRNEFHESIINIHKLCHIDPNINPKDINPFERNYIN